MISTQLTIRDIYFCNNVHSVFLMTVIVFYFCKIQMILLTQTMVPQVAIQMQEVLTMCLMQMLLVIDGYQNFEKVIVWKFVVLKSDTKMIMYQPSEFRNI